jgi:hypothetical protein
MRHNTSRGRLVCQECRFEDDQGFGWKAYIADEFEVLVYCPACAKREFGGEQFWLEEDSAA